MITNKIYLKPQEIFILSKIISCNLQKKEWNTVIISRELYMSQSEVSESLRRSVYAGLYEKNKKEVFRNALYEFLIYGIKYAFPAEPGPIVRGIATAHSAIPLSKIFHTNDIYVWGDPNGNVRGHSIEPLYKSVVKAVKDDTLLYMILALIDAIRVGRSRERNIAQQELENIIVKGIY